VSAVFVMGPTPPIWPGLKRACSPDQQAKGGNSTSAFAINAPPQALLPVRTAVFRAKAGFQARKSAQNG
jgi:hypothetical protein